MNSMTGYGGATFTAGALSVAVQLSSVNRRTLDLTVSLPEEWEPLEPAVLAVLREGVRRGKVHVAITAADAGSASGWSEEAVAEQLRRLQALAAAQDIPFAPSADLLWQIANARRHDAGLPSPDEVSTDLLAAVGRALRELQAMRAREGEALLVDFLGRLEKLRVLTEGVAQRAPAVAPAYREALLQRLRTAGLSLDLTDERVLKEIALFADRCDVVEELTRLRSHLHQLQELLRADGDIGRKAEFILQEIGREIHTVGSKANDLAISQKVIEFKNELERVREQIANVE